ncbi:hypothetical protein ACEQ8H_003233 [Pleosporales sp. CAS-2024a]
MSHPAHPATVHFPITTTVLTGGLDAVYFASSFAPTASVVASIFKTLGIAIQPSMFPVLSYYTTILTLLFTVPAIVTGAQQLMPVIQRDGFSSKKAKVGVSHALINDLAALGALYNWWTRRGNAGFAPDATNMLISTAVALPTTLYAAYLGGSLVYVHGMGFQNRSAKKTQ